MAGFYIYLYRYMEQGEATLYNWLTMYLTDLGMKFGFIYRLS